MSHDKSDVSVDKESQSDEEHPIFSKDPVQWMDLIHKHVSITTEDGNQHKGWVYTVDPVSESVVLVENVLSGNKVISVQILIGPSVSQLEVLSTSITEGVKEACDRLFRPMVESSLNEEETLKRRSDLKTWLEKHRIPVCVGGYDGQSLSVLSDALIIQPPFTADSCLSTNEIILSKIQGLINALPSS